MDVTIIGTGNMARGIGSRLVSGGHAVTLLGTERSNAEALAADLGGSVSAGTVGDPIADDVVVLAVWYPVTLDVAQQAGSQLDAKVVVDISNPLDTETFEPIVPDAGSGAEELAAAVPGARVVKAFNTTFAGTLSSGEVSGHQLDVLLASDDADAKRTVASLVESSGLRAVDAGPLRRARQLEALGYLHMAVQEGLGTGYGSAVKIVG
ncbi:NADPH-dependent F420 reductase [Gaiella sp.]|jgi:8-hydroxy-5-deazaflavin:NADPH oxidoreductase|uniref:NADPH-dependent F420 reductase n=1 Tax=Gaiella sp. TaxID=2663207 RepID=UPI002C344DCB|nr:NADPH-dependent F420 reductase [Gaiella sp.]HWO81385.1 NADPH-dependent F420 reductase [Gaiella sp.]